MAAKAAIHDYSGTERKKFFFEKKNQKTFALGFRVFATPKRARRGWPLPRP
jgi:hypothetical protein